MSMTTHATATDRTADIAIATTLIAEGKAVLLSLQGEPGRRVFVFDRPIPQDFLLAFHSSPAKRLLDTFRSLKIAAMTQ